MAKAGKPVVHRVRVPLGGMTVAEAKSRARAHGIDPDSPEARLIGLEQIDTGWEAVVTFSVGASGAIPVGVELRSTRGQPLNRAVWDRVRVREVIDEAAALVSWLAPITKHPERAEPFERRPQRRGRGKGRPNLYSDDHYRRVAALYKAAEANQLPPVRAVAEAFAGQFPGLDSPTDRRARSWVRAARARGYLPQSGDEQ